MRLRRSVPVLALLTVAGVAVAPLAWPQASVEDYLVKLSGADAATYQARRLVVYLDAPQAAAVVEEHSSPDGVFVRSDAGTETVRMWLNASWGLITDDRTTIEDSSPPAVPFKAKAVQDKYDVRIGDTERLLGVDVVPLGLVRRDDRKLVERLWLDPQTGVVYRRELYGADGDLIGMSTMLEMSWGEAVSTEESPPVQKRSKTKLKKVSDAPDELPYGYELVKAYAFTADDGPAEHWVYSDGLHTLSVFRTKGVLDRPDDFEQVDSGDGDVWVGPGPGTWTWEGDGYTWMVVAEEPQIEAAKLTGGLPKGGPSVWSRLGSWWARAFRWVGGLFS